MVVRDGFMGSNMTVVEIKDKKQRKTVLLSEIITRAQSLAHDESISNLTDLYELVRQYSQECGVDIKKEARTARKNSGGYERCKTLREFGEK